MTRKWNRLRELMERRWGRQGWFGNFFMKPCELRFAEFQRTTLRQGYEGLEAAKRRKSNYNEAELSISDADADGAGDLDDFAVGID